MRQIICTDCGCAVIARGSRTVRCRECQLVHSAEIIRKWRENNKERKAELERKWRENNKERNAETMRKWYENNKERKYAHNRKWYENNKGSCAANSRRWSKNNPDYKRNRRRNANDKRLAHEMAAAELALRTMLG